MNEKSMQWTDEMEAEAERQRGGEGEPHAEFSKPLWRHCNWRVDEVGLKQGLLSRAGLEGALLYFIQGARLFCANGRELPKKPFRMKEATKAGHDEADVVATFVREELVELDADGAELAKDMVVGKKRQYELSLQELGRAYINCQYKGGPSRSSLRKELKTRGWEYEQLQIGPDGERHKARHFRQKLDDGTYKVLAAQAAGGADAGGADDDYNPFGD